MCSTETLLTQELSSEFLVAVVNGHAVSKDLGVKVVKQLCSYHEHEQNENTIQECMRERRRDIKHRRAELEMEKDNLKDTSGKN